MRLFHNHTVRLILKTMFCFTHSKETERTQYHKTYNNNNNTRTWHIYEVNFIAFTFFPTKTILSKYIIYSNSIANYCTNIDETSDIFETTVSRFEFYLLLVGKGHRRYFLETLEYWKYKNKKYCCRIAIVVNELWELWYIRNNFQLLLGWFQTNQTQETRMCS